MTGKTKDDLQTENEELRQRVAQLQQVRHLSRVFRDAADPILIEDLDGNVTDMNEEAVRAYGWTREELIGKPIKTIVPPERHGQADQLLHECRAGKAVRNIEGETSCGKAKRSSGRW